MFFLVINTHLLKANIFSKSVTLKLTLFSLSYKSVIIFHTPVKPFYNFYSFFIFHSIIRSVSAWISLEFWSTYFKNLSSNYLLILLCDFYTSLNFYDNWLNSGEFLLSRLSSSSLSDKIFPTSYMLLNVLIYWLLFVISRILWVTFLLCFFIWEVLSRILLFFLYDLSFYRIDTTWNSIYAFNVCIFSYILIFKIEICYFWIVYIFYINSEILSL